MDKAKKKILTLRGITIGCFIICFLIFLNICINKTTYRGDVETTRIFWGVMTIIAAISIAQVEIMLAILYPNDFKRTFENKKFLFIHKKIKIIKSKVRS